MIISELQEYDSSFFNSYETVGFHATSSLMTNEIERVGFLPRKIFRDSDHDEIIKTSKELGLNVSSYVQWLAMRSVTFTKDIKQAVHHAKEGRAGGQGLIHIERLLYEIREKDSQKGAILSNHIGSKIQQIRSSSKVVYAVDLSGLGTRLVDDVSSGFLQIYWNPNAALPDQSEIDPSRIIVKLLMS